MKKTILSLVLLLAFSTLYGQEAVDHQHIVNRLAKIMNKNYVFPEKGKSMYELIKGKQAKGEYDHLTNPEEFANQLEVDLRAVINDKHIRVRYDNDVVNDIRSGTRGGGRRPLENYGFVKVKKLEGNIGYLDLRAFVDPAVGENAARKAMDELITADVLIFDLRQNGGGSPAMIRFISSYLFGDEPVHLNDFYWRPRDSYQESWTDPHMASVHKPDVPIYVLTSDYTFSAAEEFTYNLKHLKRATIVGEVTGGGAHPGGPAIIDNGFFVNVPRGRAINPITKTNWEGVGVIPHIQIESEEALDKALELAKVALSKN